MEIPARFNAASFFVDRHVAEGRGDKVAFFYEDTSLTYGAMAELVNRAGNALLDLGVQPEQRVLLLLLDSLEFVATFWGAIKIGAIPIPVNTMLRADDYLYFLEDSRARVAVISEALLARGGADPGAGQAPEARGRGRQAEWNADRLRRVDRPGLVTTRGGRYVQGRARALALFVGLDGPAQGRRAPPARHGLLHRGLRARGARDDRGGPHGVGGQALLRLRARQQPVLPHGRGRAGRALSAPTAPRSHVRADPPPPADALLRRPDALCRHAAGQGGGEALRPLVAPPLRLRGRGAARGSLPPLAGHLRRRDAGRHRHHGDPAHLPVESSGAGAARRDGVAGARLRGPGRRR